MDVEASSHSSAKNIFVCNLCNITFTRKSGLQCHEKKFHNTSYAKCNQACPLCSEKCRTIADLHKHIEIKHHDVNLHFEEKIFYQESDFEKWKSELECETVSSFVLSFTKSKDTSKVRQYRCNRSGAAKVKSIRKKHSKYTGSIKTGVICPAIIKVINEDSTIIVKYQSTHVGHECEVEKLPLKNEDRVKIASMLNSNLTISDVMDRIQAEFSHNKRVSLITRQDIYNIARDFNVSYSVQKDDLMAVDTTVKKMMQDDNNPGIIMMQDEIFEDAEEKSISKQLKRKNEIDSNDQRLECEKMWENISKRMQSLESSDSFQYIKENLRNIQAYLNISEDYYKCEPEILKIAPPNKKICPQRRYKKQKKT